ncbi:MAG: hypothetical protein AB1668_02640 [Nanoarchaeota archaeon]
MQKEKRKKKIKRKKLVSSALAAVISVGVFYNNPISAAFTTPLDFKFFNFLKDVLLQFYHLLFLDRKTP